MFPSLGISDKIRLCVPFTCVLVHIQKLQLEVIAAQDSANLNKRSSQINISPDSPIGVAAVNKNYIEKAFLEHAHPNVRKPSEGENLVTVSRGSYIVIEEIENRTTLQCLPHCFKVISRSGISQVVSPRIHAYDFTKASTVFVQGPCPGYCTSSSP